MISIPIPASTPPAQATAYLEGVEASAMLPALYTLGAGASARGARIALRVNGEEVNGLQVSATLAADGSLSSWGIEIAGRPASWSDVLATLGPPMGDRPVEIGLLIGDAWVPILAQGMVDNADISLSWDARESYDGIGREARHQRAAVDLNLMPGHGQSYRQMIASILPDLEMPADPLLDTPRYKQVAFTATSPLAIVAQLLDWTAYRVVAGRNSLRLVDTVRIGAAKAIRVLGGDAKIKARTDIPTIARVIAYRDVVDTTPPETIVPVTAALPAVLEYGTLELPAISTQAAGTGTLTPLRAAIAQDETLLRRITGVARTLRDAVIYQRQSTEAWGQQETARYTQDGSGTATPSGGVVVESAGGANSPAYIGDSTFGVREVSESWQVFDWAGTEYPASVGDPWEVLARLDSGFTPGPGTGYRLGSVTSGKAYRVLEGAVRQYSPGGGTTSPMTVHLAGDGRGLGDSAFPAPFATLIETSRVVEVIEQAPDNAAKVGRVTTWELAHARVPGAAYQFADGANAGADTEDFRIVRRTIESWQKVGESWQKLTLIEPEGQPSSLRIEAVDARPDRERLEIAPDESGNAPVIRRDMIKVDVDSGLDQAGHPRRLEVLNLEGPESIEEAIYAGEVYLKRECGLALTAAAYAPDALADPADTLEIEGYTCVLQSATYSQEGGSTPLCRFEALIPWGGL